ncbi:G2/mitotic-specific cyclin-B2-like isoform X2 [Galleria mellonella]|uniref:G2/mitotic-specific cyclin-B2-like isoform X2 n=1 Tax=Galleria mellonella TaxID=7137 RepID=A0A6J3C8X3_GALME|nr:G2/mitotic-specific cyclin-B2-like isoform X2 [Galleria mellonella]
MDIHVRRFRSAQVANQENGHFNKTKTTMVLPSKRQDSVRGVLGELDHNVQAQRENNKGKVAITAAEFEKKAIVNRCQTRHVQSKVDTGLVSKNMSVQQPSKPVLRREESTASLAARAVARTRAVLKETADNQTEHRDVNILIQAKKSTQITKRNTKLPILKENNKETKALKPVLKESTDSLGKLKLVETTTYKEKSTATINHSNGQTKETLFEKNTFHCHTPKLPDDIEDIDASDNNSPLLMSIYIKDIYNYLIELEEKYPIEPDHLKFQIVLTGKMRATLIDWLVEVQRQFSLVLETLHLTVGIIDRYLQLVPNIQRDQLQLVGITAMFIASKYEEIYAPDVGDFVYVTDNAYSKSDVFKCERDIMSKLKFCLARPIPLSFLRRFVKAAHGTSKNHHLAKYFVDLCLVEYSMAHYRPSELAAAAICLSLYLLSTKELDEVWTPTMVYYSTYSLSHIKPIIRKIAKVVINVENSKFKAVYNKYLDATLAKVSMLPQLKGEAIHELAKLPLDSSDS